MGAKALRYNIRRDIIKCRALCVFISWGRLLFMDQGFFSGLSSWLILACRQETSANISLPLFLLFG